MVFRIWFIVTGWCNKTNNNKHYQPVILFVFMKKVSYWEHFLRFVYLYQCGNQRDQVDPNARWSQENADAVKKYYSIYIMAWNNLLSLNKKQKGIFFVVGFKQKCCPTKFRANYCFYHHFQKVLLRKVKHAKKSEKR